MWYKFGLRISPPYLTLRTRFANFFAHFELTITHYEVPRNANHNTDLAPPSCVHSKYALRSRKGPPHTAPLRTRFFPGKFRLLTDFGVWGFSGKNSNTQNSRLKLGIYAKYGSRIRIPAIPRHPWTFASFSEVLISHYQVTSWILVFDCFDIIVVPCSV